MSEPYYTTGAARAERVHELFGRIAKRYDLINDVQSLGLHRLWKRRLILKAMRHRAAMDRSSMRVLDLCCGTGDIALRLAKDGFDVEGVDFSEKMLDVAQKRSNAAHFKNLHWRCCDVLKLDDSDSSYDVITCAYGLRNLADIPEAIRLIYRLVVPGGLVLILDFGKPQNPLLRGLYRAYLASAVPLFGAIACGDSKAYSYILDSLDHYPAQAGVDEYLRQVGFINTGWDSFIGGTMSINYAYKKGK